MKKSGRQSILDKAKRVNIRLYNLDRLNLSNISKLTGENNSQIMRRLIKEESEKK